MEIAYKKSVSINDGLHEGVITKIGYRTEPYQYTDVVISTEEGKIELKVSYPTVLSDKSMLGEIMIRFGAVMMEGMTYNPERTLIGKKCSFITMTKKGKDNKEYSEIIKESLKPIKETLGGAV